MRILLTALLVTAASMPALAQDNIDAFFDGPPVESGRVSQPAPEETARREAEKPVVVVAEEPEAEEVPAPVGMEPAPLVGDAAKPQTSLIEVLAKSYGSSPTLKAEREKLRIQYEEVAQADALALPTLDAEGGVGLTHSDVDPGSKDDFVSKDIGLTLIQPVWTGGRIKSYIDQQVHLSDAQIAAYELVTQQVFLNVVTAAMDVTRDRAVIDLSEKNREVIAGQLKAAENGFEVGALTKTDVAQSRARLAEADAGLAAANAAYASSLARFTQYAGMDASSMDFAHETANLNLPADLMGAQSKADSDNPQIQYAQRLKSAAEEAIDVAEGDLYPSVGIVGTASRDWHTVAAVDDSENATLGLRATMNLYEGGATQSRIRQAKSARYEREDRIVEAQRDVTQQVTTAWNNHQAALVSITALNAQVDAATIARNGVYKEREVGTRTVLDSLDAERELLNAQVGLVRAQRDAVVADYALLAATGQLTPSRLGLMSPEAEHDVMNSSRGAFKGNAVQPRD